MRAWQLLFLATAPWLGCTLDFDEVGPYGGSSGTAGAQGGAGSGGDGVGGDANSTETSTSTGMGGCLSSGGNCVPLAPPEWLGPVARAASGTDACLPPAASLSSGGRALAARQPPCPCEPLLPACTQPEVTFYTPTACSASNVPPHEHVVAGDECEVIDPPVLTTSLRVTGMPAATPGNTCGLDGRAPYPLYEEPGDLCAFDAFDDCGDEQACVPAGPPSCIYKAGDHDCPAGWDLPATFVTAQSQCACSSVVPSVPTCAGVLDFWYGTTCSGLPDFGDVPATMPTCQSGAPASEYRVQYEPSGTSTCDQVDALPFVIGSFTLCCAAT